MSFSVWFISKKFTLNQNYITFHFGYELDWLVVMLQKEFFSGKKFVQIGFDLYFHFQQQQQQTLALLEFIRNPLFDGIFWFK